MCYCDLDDIPQGFRAAERTARKSHRCCECGRTIRPGERYEYASGIWDGTPGAFKTCGTCSVVRDYFADYLCECAPAFRCLISEIPEHVYLLKDRTEPQSGTALGLWYGLALEARQRLHPVSPDRGTRERR